MFKERIIWHLPYAMIGGVETLYATILKYIDKTKYEHYVTCHSEIYDWVVGKYPSDTFVRRYNNDQDLSVIIKEIDPDLIIGTHGGTLYSALDLLVENIPVIEIVHGAHIWVEHNVHMPKHYTKHIVCVSKNAEEVYLDNSKFGIPTSVIINGIDTEVFYPRKGFQTTARNFAYFGRFLESDKHLTKLIQAFRSLGTQHAKLYLIGGSPQEIVVLKRFAQKLKLGNAVKFFGHTPHPEEFYKEIDIVTVRSEAEGYCNVVAEAMASGVPVVCYNFGGILRHLDPGTVLVADTQKEYALMLNQVFRDRSLREKMVLKGFKFIKDKGNIALTVQAYEKLFKKILSNEPIVIRKEKRKVDLPYVGKVTVVGGNPIVGVANPNWNGIYTSTKNCTDVVVNWHGNPSVLMKNIIKHKPRHILFSGGCPGFKDTAKKIRKRHPQYPISTFYHGGVSHFSFSNGLFGKGERDALTEMIKAQQEGIYDKIAVAYPGLEEVGRRFGIRMEFTGNVFKMNTNERRRIQSSNTINIGNFNRHHDHKHTSIGLGAAMLVPNSKIHMLSCPYQLPFIDYSRVQFYREMSQPALYDLYKDMDVCLQMSFIETYNISVLEMWAHGVPVIMGAGNYFLYRDNPDLKMFCAVEDNTNPVEVAKKIQLCVENRELVVALQDQELKKLNKRTEDNWRRFFK